MVDIYDISSLSIVHP